MTVDRERDPLAAYCPDCAATNNTRPFYEQARTGIAARPRSETFRQQVTRVITESRGWKTLRGRGARARELERCLDELAEDYPDLRQPPGRPRTALPGWTLGYLMANLAQWIDHLYEQPQPAEVHAPQARWINARWGANYVRRHPRPVGTRAIRGERHVRGIRLPPWMNTVYAEARRALKAEDRSRYLKLRRTAVERALARLLGIHVGTLRRLFRAWLAPAP